MNLELYVENLNRQLAVAAEAGGDEARALAERYDVLVYDGDRAERDYVARCTPESTPTWALLQAPPSRTWNGTSSQAVTTTRTAPTTWRPAFAWAREDPCTDS